MIYILSYDTIENGGGIYAYDCNKSGKFEKSKYFPCEKPMYALKCKKGLCVLLRQPYENNENSGYFYIDEDLKTPTGIRSTQGKCACHLCADGDDIYIVNYLSGNLVKNGELIAKRTGKSVHLIRQTQPHTHFVNKTPDGNLIVCDLGTDTLAIYDKGLQLISETKVPSGYGIRHLVFSINGKYIYAINELVPSITIFSYHNGRATYVHTIEINCRNEKANGAAIRLSKDGKYLYVSLREENVICVYSVDCEKLTFLQTIDCGGDSPRDFNILEKHLIVCNERGNVIVFLLKNNGLFEREQVIEIRNTLCVI